MARHLASASRRVFNLGGIAHLDQQQVAQVIDHLAGKLARVAAGVQGGVDALQAAGRPCRSIRASTRSSTAWLVAVPSTSWASSRVIGSPVEASWSSSEMASRMAPVDWRAIRVSASASTWMFSSWRHLFQIGDDIRHRDAAELVALAARKHRGRDLVHLGGRQDENGMRRRLFQRLQQGVEGCRGEHVDFVDDVDFVAPLVGGKIDLIAQVAHIFDAGVGGGVDLDQVQEAALVDRLAVLAFVARALRPGLRPGS